MEHLTDAPIPNILILAAILFLAVGIFGKVGGFLGSIFGSIEAGQKGRMLSGGLGVALMVAGFILHSQADKAPPPASNSLAGTWVYSAESGHDTLYKLEIMQQGTRVIVHAWGRCEMRDCDWGVRETSLSGDTTTATWTLEHGARQAAVTLGPVESGSLHVVVHNTYADGRAPKPVERFFPRAR